MYKESYPPVVNINIILFYTEKAHIGIVRDVFNGYCRHQPAEKCQQGKQRNIPNICAG
jgi:hypothetical protein